jgi:FKBP-type peptidyl-prolyl cis-trans isomerase 2
VRRPLLVLPLVLASALVLAGCAGDDPTESTPEETPAASVDICETSGGDAVDALTVSGDFGTTPTVDFTAPLDAVEATQVAVAIDGGSQVAPGANVQAAYLMINGTTGETIDTYGYGEGEEPIEFRADLDALRVGFAKALGCAGPGTRVVAVIPPDEGFGDEAVDSGVAEDDVVIFVADILADLSPAEWVTDVPEVGGTEEAPTVTLPAAAPKTDLEIAVLAEGDGDVVGPADSVSVHYLGTAWESGEIFDQSYTRGEPSTFSVQGVVPGFRDALIGQKVGTRLIVTMPPSLGYGPSEGHELQNSTLVFLIDIVAIAG